MTDYEREFGDYLDRFQRLVGEMDTGQYGRFKGRLVRKLDDQEFRARLDEYVDLGERFVRTLNAGDTIDDLLAVELKGLEADLVLERSRFLPDFGDRR